MEKIVYEGKLVLSSGMIRDFHPKIGKGTMRDFATYAQLALKEGVDYFMLDPNTTYALMRFRPTNRRFFYTKSGYLELVKKHNEKPSSRLMVYFHQNVSSMTSSVTKTRQAKLKKPTAAIQTKQVDDQLLEFAEQVIADRKELAALRDENVFLKAQFQALEEKYSALFNAGSTNKGIVLMKLKQLINETEALVKKIEGR